MEDVACLTFKIAIPDKYKSILNDIYDKSILCLDRMLKDRTKNSTKYYREIPSVLAKGLISKYQRNRKLKQVKNLVLPICGDKGKVVKIVNGGIRIPPFFKKDVIHIEFPKEIIGFIRHAEFFKRNKKWFMSYSYNVKKEKPYKINGFLGVDRNSSDNVATIADCDTGKVRKIGPSTSDITRIFRNRRSKLQKKKNKSILKKIRRKQSNRIKDINHKVSRSIVDYAKLHCSAIVLEDLNGISKGKNSKRYVQKSQWSFYQLETFIKYKAALLGVPVVYINPAYTSQVCSKCGSINKTKGKDYKCYNCRHFDHRDVNAAFNISAQANFIYEQSIEDNISIERYIGGPLNWTIEKAIEPELEGSIL